MPESSSLPRHDAVTAGPRPDRPPPGAGLLLHGPVRRPVLGTREIEPEGPLIANVVREPSHDDLDVALPRDGADR